MKKKNHVHSHSTKHECGNMLSELFIHFPYSVFAVALTFSFVALLEYFSFGASSQVIHKGCHLLFHTFHYLHIVFAATGALLTYFRFSKKIIPGLLVGGISTIAFCILSDILFPYFAGKILGVHMHLHICFFTELYNVLPFLFIGMVNGWVLAQHDDSLQESYSVWSHFGHILVSAFASMLYAVAHGFTTWPSHMGALFILMIAAVVIPCTLSDIVVPLYFARGNNK